VIFGLLNPEKISLESLTDLFTSLVRCSHFILGNPKKKLFSTVLFIHTSDYLHYLKRKQTVIHLPPHLKCHHTNLWIAKLFYLTEDLLHSFKRWRFWTEPVVGCHQWLWWQKTGCDVWQAVSQQVFRVTTFCVNTCFQSILTLISRTVHHAVLKFSPWYNKLLPQAATHQYQYTRSFCNMPRCSTRAMQIIGSTKQQ